MTVYVYLLLSVYVICGYISLFSCCHHVLRLPANIALNVTLNE